MDNMTLLKTALIIGSLLLVSRRILELSLSVLASTTALIVSLIGIIISMILLIIVAIPTTIFGCAIANRVNNGKYMTGVVADICKHKNHPKSGSSFNAKNLNIPESRKY